MQEKPKILIIKITKVYGNKASELVALDSNTGQKIIDILREINKKRKTVLIIIHDMNVAQKCKRVINVIDGKIK